MRSAGRSITILLVGTGMLLLGQGLLITVLPIRAGLEAFSTTTIGWIGGGGSLGFALGCLIGPALVRQVGHIRAFAGFAALAAALSLVFELYPLPAIWLAARGLSGTCFAVLFMVIESWLNDQSTNANRGKVLSAYIIVVNLVTMGGQLSVNLYEPSGPELFILTAILICISLAPVSLVSIAEPTPPPEARVRIAALYRLSPVGFVGCLLFGLVDASFWSLGPVFAQARGFSVAGITLFMSAFMLGGTISQWPIGWLSDRIDRRLVIAGCCLGTIGTGLGLAFMPTHEGLVPFAVACLHGAFMLPLYALILAHANDFAPQEKLVETSSALLLVYSAGAIVGPPVVAPMMERVDAGYLFLTMAVLFAVLALFVFWRMGRRPIAAAVERVTFVPVPKGSQAFYELETEEEEPRRDVP